MGRSHRESEAAEEGREREREKRERERERERELWPRARTIRLDFRGGIQEATFEEKSSGFFLHKKRRFFS